MSDLNFRRSKIDTISTKFTNRFKFFKRGFGDREFLELIPDLLKKIEIKPIELTWQKEKKFKNFTWKQGSFESPFSQFLPEEAKIANIQMLLPPNHNEETPICIHFAMTGDQGFSMRLFALALPLLRDGIGSIVLEIPFYGHRKPKGQFNIFVRTVSDFFKMCGGTISEGLSLLEWIKSQGFKYKGITGISMGGNITCFVGSLYNEKLAIVPCLPPHSPEPVFVNGMLKDSIHWKNLAKEEGDLESAKKKLSLLMEKSGLLNFPKPLSKDIAIIVAGEADAIVSPDTVLQLQNHWDGSELRWVKGGHVRSIFGKTGVFRQAIRDSFAKLKKEIK
jgi:hypothetical protein